MTNPYPPEQLNIQTVHTIKGTDRTYTSTVAEDDGTMVDSLERVSAAVVGHRIISVDKESVTYQPYEGSTYTRTDTALVLTLDNGTKAAVIGVSDCCAYTDVESFLLHADTIDHVITGVGTTDLFTTWHFYADAGDVLEVKVGWSCGNPFYYGYGFNVVVLPL